MSVRFRLLEKSDYDKGFLQLLSQLSTVGDVPRELFEQQFDRRETNPNFHTFVCEKNGKIACSATLLVEDKYLHRCSRAGHIEDVVVDAHERGTGLGKRLIRHLIDEAQKSGCYKVILDCENKNVGFYERCGLTRHGNEMSYYIK